MVITVHIKLIVGHFLATYYAYISSNLKDQSNQNNTLKIKWIETTSVESINDGLWKERRFELFLEEWTKGLFTQNCVSTATF